MGVLEDIRTYRNLELINNKDNSVFYTKIMTLEKGENTGKKIYRILEEYYTEENQSKTRELFYEYRGNEPVLIAQSNNEYNLIIPMEEMIKDEKSKNEWELLLQDIENGIYLNKENMKKQAIKSGISPLEVDELSEIELDKKIYSKIEEINKRNNSEKIKEQSENKKEDKTINIPSEKAKKHGIIGINTISLNQVVGIHGQTLKEELGIKGNPKYEDVDEIEWVPAYKINQLGKNVPDVPFVPVAKHKNGELETFPESVCKPSKEDNNKIVEIDGNEDKVTKYISDCNYKFTNGKILTARQTNLGRCESSLAYNTTDNNGRVAITVQDKYDGTKQSDIEARSIVDSYQGRENYNRIREEANDHHTDEITDRENADGKRETGHNHLDSERITEINAKTVLLYEGKELTVEEIASNSKFNTSAIDFIEKYNNIIKKGDNLSEEQIYDEIEEQVNDDMIRSKNKNN